MLAKDAMKIGIFGVCFEVNQVYTEQYCRRVEVECAYLRDVGYS